MLCLFTGRWRPDQSDNNSYIQVDFIAKVHVFGITTRGRGSTNVRAVTSYNVSYSLDGITWTMISRTFPGNTDGRTKVTNTLQAGGILTRYVRLHPVTFRGHVALRWDVIGCRSCVASYMLCNRTRSPVVTLTSSSAHSQYVHENFSCIDNVHVANVGHGKCKSWTL